MARLKRGRARRLILDLGTSAIRICELQQTKSGYQLSKYYQRETIIDPSLDEDAKREVRVEALRSLLKEAKIRAKRTLFAVPGQSVFIRNRNLPPVPEYKVTQIVKYEIKQQIPFDLDQIALDYQVLDRTEANGYSVMMAAIKVDVVEKHLDILRETKRSVEVVDVAPLAAYNWLKHTGEFGDTGECIALIDLGATTTDIVVERENQFRFPRSLNVGGNDITQAIAAAVNCTFAEAEKMKRERAFAPTGDPQRDGRMGEVIGPVLNRLVSEITRSFAYFRSQPGGGSVQRVILTGGGACLRNVVPFLQRQLGVEVRIAQPLAGLAVAPTAQEASEHPEQSAVVLGLALRSIERVPIEVNLIPPRILGMARRKEQAFYWVLSLATFGLILASIIPVQAAKDEQVQKQIGQLETVLGTYDPKLINDPTKPSEYEAQLMGVEQNVEKYQGDLKFLRDQRDYAYFWTDYLDAIASARPSSTWMAFSMIETAVIGGPQNTGDAWRAAQNPLPAPDPAAAPAATPESSPAVSPGSGSPSRRERRSMTNIREMMEEAGGPSAPGRGARPGAAPEGYSSEGFPGITSGTVSGTGGIGGLAMGRSRRDRGPGSPGATAEGPTAPEIHEPNGISIQGYTESPKAFKEFVDNLKASELFTEVYYSEADLVEVPEYEMYQAPVTAAGGGGMPSSGRRGGEERGFSGLSSVGVGTGGTAYSGALPPGVKEGLRFRVDAQFQGNVVPQPEMSIAASGRGGLGGGRGGLGGGRGRGRE